MTDPIDTARAEGVALGLAMAAQKYAKHGAIALAECVETNVSWRHEIYRSILALAPIPPHVAAARVLLDVMDSAVWRSAIAAMEPILRADIQPTAWNSEDEIMSALTAALEQIAKEGELCLKQPS